MKPMKFVKSEKEHVFRKTFINIEKSHQSWNVFFAFLYKPEKALKLNSLDIFFLKKWFFSYLKDFMGFMVI